MFDDARVQTAYIHLENFLRQYDEKSDGYEIWGNKTRPANVVTLGELRTLLNYLTG